jgi:aminoglycoside phosphotransferase family enzyme
MKENKTIGRVAATDVSMEEKVSFLKQPAAYSCMGVRVKVKETHMSWVFLVDDVAYKLKKPVVNRLFDFRTLEARLENCREEVRLNRKLASDIYLGIVSLTVSQSGKLQIEKAGKIVDWLVKMKRIPEKNMLDYGILHDSIDEINLKHVARLLTEFYKRSAPVPMTMPEYIKKLEAEILFNYNELSLPLFELSPLLLSELKAGQMAFLKENHSLFNERVKSNKIIEAHGDLRPEHICLGPSPAIIDRLEFNKELRIMDIAEELSFLSMECEMMGNRTAGQIFLGEYIKITNDIIPPSLITFYKIKKACLRAYLVARHKEEDRYKDDPKWLARTTAYLKLGESYYKTLMAA